MLSESAEEVRNQAKLAILTMKNNIQNQWELDGLLGKSGLNTKEME